MYPEISLLIILFKPVQGQMIHCRRLLWVFNKMFEYSKMTAVIQQIVEPVVYAGQDFQNGVLFTEGKTGQKFELCICAVVFEAYL
jgi:hypothetical protein